MPPTNQSSSILKRIYDLITVLVSVCVLNYAAAPFMLLSLPRSLVAWRLLGWYGHYVVGGALVFFYIGGAGLLQALGGGAATKGSKGGEKKEKKEEFTPTSSGATTPVAEKQFQIPPSLDRVLPPPKP